MAVFPHIRATYLKKKKSELLPCIWYENSSSHELGCSLFVAKVWYLPSFGINFNLAAGSQFSTEMVKSVKPTVW